MNYLLSIKASRDAKPMAQAIMNDHDCLNCVRKAMLGIQRMEETSADIRAIHFMDTVDTKPQAIENRANNHCLIVQSTDSKVANWTKV